MSSSSVWVQLYYEGKNELVANPIKIRPIPENVAGLAEAVEHKMAEELMHCSSANLLVYSSDTKTTILPRNGFEVMGLDTL